MQLSERFEIDAALNDGTLPGCAPDSSQDRQRRTRCDAASSSNDDDRDCRAEIVSDEEREHRCAESEVNQIPRKAVRCLLYGSTGTLCVFDCFNDLAEGRLLP